MSLLHSGQGKSYNLVWKRLPKDLLHNNPLSKTFSETTATSSTTISEGAKQNVKMTCTHFFDEQENFAQKLVTEPELLIKHFNFFPAVFIAKWSLGFFFFFFWMVNSSTVFFLSKVFCVQGRKFVDLDASWTLWMIFSCATLMPIFNKLGFKVPKIWKFFRGRSSGCPFGRKLQQLKENQRKHKWLWISRWCRRFKPTNHSRLFHGELYTLLLPPFSLPPSIHPSLPPPSLSLLSSPSPSPLPLLSLSSPLSLSLSLSLSLALCHPPTYKIARMI